MGDGANTDKDATDRSTTYEPPAVWMLGTLSELTQGETGALPDAVAVGST